MTSVGRNRRLQRAKLVLAWGIVYLSWRGFVLMVGYSLHELMP